MRQLELDKLQTIENMRILKLDELQTIIENYGEFNFFTKAKELYVGHFEEKWGLCSVLYVNCSDLFFDREAFDVYLNDRVLHVTQLWPIMFKPFNAFTAWSVASPIEIDNCIKTHYWWPKEEVESRIAFLDYLIAWYAP